MTRALLERTVKTMYAHEGNWSEETRLLVIAIQAELAKPEQECKPMTRAQREQAAKKAVEARTADANLSWRDALIYETEIFHGIKETP